MRILYFHQYFNTPDMSGGTRSYEMARRLVAAGHEVHIITSWLKETDEKTWFTTVEAGIHVHWFPNFYNNKMSYTDRVKAFFRFAYHATKK
ncbi:glycosyltransferase family 4 protein, partial [Acinetobacter baumannii]|nr:glycosyltransferase family 4 protein [Acinetobacter baumannii]